MATYRTFKELNGKTLKYADIVILQGYRYIVQDNHLYARETSNDRIFDQLALNKMQLAIDAYGYKTMIGIWPVSGNEDYEALTRLCLVLLALQEGSPYVDVKMPDGSWKRIVPQTQHKVGEYSACVLDKDTLKVGCQRITFEQVEAVYKTMLAFRTSRKKSK